jgi:hypothetical protein
MRLLLTVCSSFWQQAATVLLWHVADPRTETGGLVSMVVWRAERRMLLTNWDSEAVKTQQAVAVAARDGLVRAA